MRLKQLELQGYKTFALRTRFAFDSGITAIVGPNGSGKSNIADAIRWVLGEQSYRVLRGKRTEDMIFSGSAQRPRLGMASASLVFDNGDGWLPIDFSEVSITRRAYRSGENEYLINGRQVRLADIMDLLAKSGLAQRTYTVIGQGLVDAVLSLRAEDRRALFEEAAGIAALRAKRSDALSRLEETRSNLLRVNDIIGEIAPRLQRLEHEAERARLRALLEQQLEGLLRTWYGHRWHQVQLELQRIRDTEARRERRVARDRLALEQLRAETAALRDRQSGLRDRLAGWYRESGDLHREMEEVQRSLAVWQERARLLSLQNEELQGNVAALEIEAGSVVSQLQGAEDDLAALAKGLREREAEAAIADEELANCERRKEALAEELGAVELQVLDLATRRAALLANLAQVAERRRFLAREREEHETAAAGLRSQVAQAKTELESLIAGQARLRAEREILRLDVARLDAALSSVRVRQEAARAAQTEARLEVEKIQTQKDLLLRMREEGEGLSAGVRAVMVAAGLAPSRTGVPRQSAPVLRGIIGPVVRLLHVPTSYEVAIEVALAGHLQDLVVESWADAADAIAYLYEGRHGRATFLPLDTVRPVPRLQLPTGVEKGPGLPFDLIGWAADLVQYEARLSSVVELLLGHTLVVRDLPDARRAMDLVRGDFQIVTLAGEVLSSRGSVSGGQGRGEEHRALLTRERAWRELPARLGVAQSRLTECSGELASEVAVEQRLLAEQATLTTRERELSEALADTEQSYRRLEREIDRASGQIAWRDGVLARLVEQAVEMDAEDADLHIELERLTSEEETFKARAADLRARLAEESKESVFSRLVEARTAAALARRNWEYRRALADGLQARSLELEAELRGKRERLAALQAETDALAQQIQTAASRECVLRAWIAGLAQQIGPAEAEIARMEEERERLDQQDAAVRMRLREAEAGLAKVQIARARQEDRRQRLRRQIMDDFGLVDLESAADLPDQLPLPLEGIVSTFPVVETLPPGLEDEIHQTRAQIRRIGPCNPHAPDEYAEVATRHAFLTTQAADLEEAARHLREVMQELDEVMRREFQTTFQVVAERFERNFSRLFGGGVARLALTDPDDLTTTGVEIVARPPGKRQQTLALLSGGERSLTAVALIFAFLETSPPPFCILDEVDAMLDESNVRRFREMLESLALHTQFIVITHNRTTIQAARTLYGVSIGEDSVSQVVSLRLDEDRIIAPAAAQTDSDPTEEPTSSKR